MTSHASAQSKNPGGWRSFTSFRITVLLALCLVSCVSYPATQTVDVPLGDRVFSLEIAADPAARYQGLSDRDDIGDTGGMLFVYPRSQRVAFVMRRCLIPLDLILLDENGTIVALHHMQLEPYDARRLPRYSADEPVMYAMEIAGGLTTELGLRPGQVIDLPDAVSRIPAS